MTDTAERPKMQRVREILAAAGDGGILSTDVAEHFAAKNPQYTLGWTCLLLSRARYEGQARRGLRRETPPDGDGRRAAYRWWITPKGAGYLNPDPPPQITPMDEPPSSRRVLEILTGAGEEGIRGPDIARHFTVPEPSMQSQRHLNGKSQSLQRRLAWTNQILDRFLAHGYVRCGGTEPSPFYHNVPALRWFITAEGARYLADGLAEGRRQVRREREEAERVRLAAHRKRLADLLTKAYAENDPATTPQCERERVIRKLRAEGCTLADIGDVFGVTRERIRQILVGLRTHPCQCDDCKRLRTAVQEAEEGKATPWVYDGD